MTSRSLLARLCLAVLAAVQLSLPAAAVLADARWVDQSRWIGVHVEQRPCSQDYGGHPDDCALCHFVGHSGAPLGCAVRVPLPAERGAIALVGLSDLSASSDLRLPRSRAPPLS